MSGVLPIALGESVKIIGIMTHTVKEYIALMELHSETSEDRLRRVIEMFVGEIYQRPPLRSSVKRSLRVRRVHEIEVLDILGRWVLMRIKTDPGTYIRKIIHDIGLILGVGAHMRELRRVRTGVFDERLNLTTLHKISEAVYLYREEGDEKMLRELVMPIELGVAHIPKIVINTYAVDPIARGAQLAVPGVVMIDKSIKRGDIVAIMSPKAELVAIARAEMDSEEVMARDKGIVARSMRVIMRAGVYPKWTKKSETGGAAAGI